MHEQHISLEDIRREAELLEFDIDTSSGYLDIRKRADTSTAFYSFQGSGDPRVLAGAWEFLQHYRAQLDQIDTARREIANQPPEQHPQKITLYQAIGFAVAFLIGVAIALITNNSLLALLVFCTLFTIIIFIRTKGNRHAGRR